jgi:hypothetical protein
VNRRFCHGRAPLVDGAAVHWNWVQDNGLSLLMALTFIALLALDFRSYQKGAIVDFKTNLLNPCHVGFSNWGGLLFAIALTAARDPSGKWRHVSVKSA